MTPKGDWNEWKNHVLSELKRFDKRACALEEKMVDGFEKVLSEVSKINTTLAVNKVKHSLWGTLGGAVTVAAFLLLEHFIK